MKLKKKLILVGVFILIVSMGAVAYKFFSKNNNVKIKNVFYPIKDDNTILNNPYIGIVPGADGDEKAIKQPFSMVYAGISWRDLEPTKGQYDFNTLEEKYKFSYWKEHEKKIIIRLFMDYPTTEKHMDIPDWLYEEIGQKGIWYDQDGNKGFSPDYTNKVLLENHDRLIKALAQRYDNDSSIAFVQLGSIGHWGEWHTTYIDYGKGSFPAADISDQYVQQYIDNFKNKKLLIRRPYQIAKDNNIGLFNDAFGDKLQTEEYFITWIKNGYKDFNVDQKLPAMPDFWRTSPSGGEFANFPGEIYLESKNFNGVLQMLKNSHTSWLGPSLPVYTDISKDKKKNLETLIKTMGYRFQINESHYKDRTFVGDAQDGNINVTNKGIAPFYYDWPLYLSLTDVNNKEVSNFKLDYDIKKIMPGTTDISYKYLINDDILAGIYKQQLFIEDPDNKKPAIEFANVASNNSKKYDVGQFIIQLPKPLYCDDYVKNGWYNYIGYKNDELTIKAYTNEKRHKTNSCYIYGKTKVKSDWSSDIKLDNLNGNTKDLIFKLKSDKDTYNLFKITMDSNHQLQLKTGLGLTEKGKSISVDSKSKITVEKKDGKIAIFETKNSSEKKEIYNSSFNMSGENINVGLQVDLDNSNSICNTTIKEFTFKAQ